MTLYTVLRQHLGDKMYMPGDEREASAGDVAHLVKAGVLAPAGERKAEVQPQNKAEAPAPENKADLEQDEPTHDPRAEAPKKGRKAGAKASEG